MYESYLANETQVSTQKNEKSKSLSYQSSPYRGRRLKSQHKDEGSSSQNNQSINKYFYQSFEASPVWRPSSATLRQSSPSFRFSKEERFNETKENQKSSSSQPILTKLSSTLSNKSCSLGKGVKQFVSSSELKRNYENPPPWHYQLDMNSQKQAASISIGTEEKFFMFKSKKQLPGPGTYEIRNKPGENACSFSLGVQLKHYYELSQAETPSCCAYRPKGVENTRFKEITFGKGDKISLINMNGVPGPGQYKLHSQFDKKPKTIKSYKLTVQKKQLLDLYQGLQQQLTKHNQMQIQQEEEDISQENDFQIKNQYFLKHMKKQALNTCDSSIFNY